MSVRKCRMHLEDQRIEWAQAYGLCQVLDRYFRVFLILLILILSNMIHVQLNIMKPKFVIVEKLQQDEISKILFPELYILFNTTSSYSYSSSNEL